MSGLLFALLERLDYVMEDGVARYRARCPACEQRRRSLLIRVHSDGVILMHCLNGCSTAHVLASIGLNWRALFPHGKRRWHRTPYGWWRERPRYESNPGPVGER